MWRPFLVVEIPFGIFLIFAVTITEGIAETALAIGASILAYYVLASLREEMRDRLRSQIAAEAGDPGLAAKLGIRPENIGKVGQVYMWTMSSKNWLRRRVFWAQAYRAFVSRDGEQTFYP